MTQPPDITTIDHWLAEQQRKKTPTSPATLLKNIETDYRNGTLAKADRDRQIAYLLELETIASEDPAIPAEDFHKLSTEDQIAHSLKQGRHIDKLTQHALKYIRHIKQKARPKKRG